MFGPSPRCPRCNKAVYAAEQVIGPGRKLYHKPCLACTSCNKRLDSLSLLEHDQEPYCKNCHTKNFGTTDLRAANLPHRDGWSPSRAATGSPVRRGSSESPTKNLPRANTGPVSASNTPFTVSRTNTGTPTKWGGSNPSCARCEKTVYFAEQAKAVGKTFHKGCLRCVKCNTLLDSSRLRDHDGQPFCNNCHTKLHGPQGGGYGLF